MNEVPSNQPSEPARRSDTPPAGVPTQRIETYPPPYQPQGAPAPQPEYIQPPAPPKRMVGAPMAGPVILIAAGIVLLLNNLDILPWGIWGDLWRLWPLALIAVGLDLIIGRRRPLASLLIILLVLGAGGALILYTGFATRGDLTTYDMNVPLGSAKSATVEIDFGMGGLEVRGGANIESLASGRLEYYANHQPPSADVEVSGERANLVIQAADEHGLNFNWFGQSRAPMWSVYLNPRVPLALNADLGVGNSTLDLGGVTLTRLDINSGTGNTTVIFPSPTGNLAASIDGGVGNLVLHIPDDAEARVSVDTGVGNVTLGNRFAQQGENVWVTSGYASAPSKLDLTVDAGVGNVEITK
ncbi:MAG: toast rack family protein [Chloroflexia bacterium]